MVDEPEVAVGRGRHGDQYWVGHRNLFALIRRTDRGLVWLNILYLLPLCLLPFGAGLLAATTGSRWPCGSTACCWSRSRSCGW